MTSIDKKIAECYALNPLQTQQQIADSLGCARQTVCKALARPAVKDYINELCAEQWAVSKNRALKNMQRIMDQDNNMALKYKATEFILKSFGIGNEQKFTVEGTEINIKIDDDNN